MAAGSGLDASTVHALTGGNPYFVTEVLRSDGNALPVSVRDAVLARVAAARPRRRTALQSAAAASGRRFDPDLLTAVAHADPADLDALVGSGLLVSDGREPPVPPRDHPTCRR